MTTFNYYPTIPNPPDNPSFDVTLMQTNSGSINSIINVDHITFGKAQGGTTGQSDGQHKQVTFFSKTTQGTPTDPLSIMYTANGGENTNAEVFYVNNSATFLLSAIKAFGVFTTSSSPVSSFGNSFGCASVSGSGTSYTIALNANVVTGNKVVVLPFINSVTNNLINWSFANPNLTLSISAANVGQQISFVVLQY